MSEISYITTNFLKALMDEPGRLVTVLEYACGVTLLVAMISDSLMRRRRLARDKDAFSERNRIGRK